MRRSYKFRIQPTKAQEINLQRLLDQCRFLYNCALEQRILGWKQHKRTLSYYDQCLELKHVSKQVEGYDTIYSRVLEQVLQKLDKAYKAFFRRVKRGEKPGFPRFKSRDRYDSFTYNRTGFKFDRPRLHLSKLGHFRWSPYRELPPDAKVKEVTVKREADGWYAVLSCELPLPEPLPKTGKVIGIDLGMQALVATSDGVLIERQRVYARNEKKLKHAQRTVSRRKKGSNRRRKAVKVLAKAWQKVTRTRKYILDGVSKQLVQNYDLIAVEDLNLKGMSQGLNRGFRRSFKDVGMGMLLHMLSYKAEEAGRIVVKVDPRGTSQECSGCGMTVKKSLRERSHSCPYCNLVLDRDVNAAKNVLDRALLSLRGEDTLVRSSVKREDGLSAAQVAA